MPSRARLFPWTRRRDYPRQGWLHKSSLQEMKTKEDETVASLRNAGVIAEAAKLQTTLPQARMFLSFMPSRARLFPWTQGEHFAIWMKENQSDEPVDRVWVGLYITLAKLSLFSKLPSLLELWTLVQSRYPCDKAHNNQA